MKIHKFNVISYFLVLISIFVSVSRANAMSQYTVVGDGVYSPPQAATPYPTLTPIANTPTPLLYDGGLNFDCPVGVPSGFGTVTPSIDWLYACAHCLPTYTPVPFETSTLGPTRTPLGTPHQAVCVTVPVAGEECYTLTPNPTLSVTTTAQVTTTPTFISGTPTIEPSRKIISVTTSQVGTCPAVFTRSISDYHNGIVIDFHVTCANTNWETSFNVNWSEAGLGPYGYYWVMDILGGSLTNFNTGIVNVGSVGVGNHTGQFSLGNFLAHELHFMKRGPGDVTGTIYVMPQEIIPTPQPQTPTPTSTMVGSNFCDQISDSNIDNLFDFDGTGTIVHQTCFTTAAISFQELFATILTNLFGFIFPSFHDFVLDWLSTVFPIEAVIDPITVCVRERDYSLYLFGYRMPIEFIFAFAIFLAGLRYFVPSMFSGASVIGSGVHSHKQEHHTKSNKVSKEKEDK